MLGLICRIVGHRRSKRDASFDTARGWRSFCSRCKAPMVRVKKGEWKLDAEPREYMRGQDRAGAHRSGDR
jgi:hypothetical protein